MNERYIEAAIWLNVIDTYFEYNTVGVYIDGYGDTLPFDSSCSFDAYRVGEGRLEYADAFVTFDRKFEVNGYPEHSIKLNR